MREKPGDEGQSWVEEELGDGAKWEDHDPLKGDKSKGLGENYRLCF